MDGAARTVLALIACNSRQTPEIKIVQDAEILPLAIKPQNLETYPGESIQFKAMGGVPPYRFLITAGKGYIHPVSGWFTSSEEEGWVNIRVRDSYNQGVSSQVRVLAPKRNLASEKKKSKK